jgi:hypothetical protein
VKLQARTGAARGLPRSLTPQPNAGRSGGVPERLIDAIRTWRVSTFERPLALGQLALGPRHRGSLAGGDGLQVDPKPHDARERVEVGSAARLAGFEAFETFAAGDSMVSSLGRCHAGAAEVSVFGLKGSGLRCGGAPPGPS